MNETYRHRVVGLNNYVNFSQTASSPMDKQISLNEHQTKCFSPRTDKMQSQSDRLTILLFLCSPLLLVCVASSTLASQPWPPSSSLPPSPWGPLPSHQTIHLYPVMPRKDLQGGPASGQPSPRVAKQSHSQYYHIG